MGREDAMLPIALSTHLSGALGTPGQLFLLLIFWAHLESMNIGVFELVLTSLDCCCSRQKPLSSLTAFCSNITLQVRMLLVSLCKTATHLLPHTLAFPWLSFSRAAITYTALFTVSPQLGPAGLMKAGLHLTCRSTPRVYTNVYWYIAGTQHTYVDYMAHLSPLCMLLFIGNIP